MGCWVLMVFSTNVSIIPPRNSTKPWWGYVTAAENQVSRAENPWFFPGWVGAQAHRTRWLEESEVVFISP